ncbi:MAG: S8 family serine peptidase, partial [Sporichthyaceae bacterium]|nr:S8 family serine peptidase [Sporichthyaceae bacterium]
MRLQRGMALLLGPALIASVLAAAGPASSATSVAKLSGRATADPPASDSSAAAGKQPQVVRLITGDRVTVRPNGAIAVTPRQGVRYLTYTADGHRHVIPTDALPLLRADRLDRRLFDVTELLRVAAHRKAAALPGMLPVIVTGAGTARAAAPTQLRATRQLPAVRGYAAAVADDQLAGFWKTLTAASSKRTVPGKVWLDSIRRPTLDVSVPQVGAPTAWAAGFDGSGVTVAVLDTGIDATHPDLITQVGAARNFVEEFEDSRDLVGHGTHVASTVAGTGAAEGGRYRGVAPGATLLDGKVCAEFGCPDSSILAGMQWAAESGADVVNMSLTGFDTEEIDPIEQAVNDLTAQHDVLFVVSAGNDGFFGDETVGSPGTADAAISVGAVTKSDALTEFSSRGPRIGPDAAIKPEITAPGEDIVAANSKDGFLGTPGEPYTTLSGTSMSAPHVSGGAAIVTQRYPGLTAEQRKAVLMASAAPNPEIGVFAQGAGRLDVARAITQEVTTTPLSVAFGRQEFPHDDDEVRSQQVTYLNSGDTAQTLELSLTTSAPAGMFTVSADTVTIPANGQASVTVSSDTTVDAPSGFYGGQLTASAGDTQVQTPFGVEVEPQRFTVTLDPINRAGAPAESFFAVLFNLETFKEYVVFGGEDPQVRADAGSYLLFTWIDDQVSEERFLTTQLVAPKVTVNQDRTIKLDARKAGGFDI